MMPGLAAHLRQLEVLVVDDEPVALQLIVRILRRLGVERITTATAAQAALELLDGRDHPPDVLLCDLRMPDMDGLVFLRHLGQRGIRSGVVLVSSADGRLVESAETLAREHGLRLLGSVEKPLDGSVLAALLGGFLPEVPGAPSAARIELGETELNEGLRGTAVHVVYQPKVEVRTARLVGVEALARWRHPTHGVLGPASFIALAERVSAMDALTRNVMLQAFADTARLRSQGLDISVAVNISADSLTLDLPEQVVAWAEQSKLAAEYVVLEVTESRLMQDLTAATEVLARLRLGGVGLAIDDFGTGFSSLAQLRRVPFTELKIDRAFVRGASNNHAAHAILESSVSLGHKLALCVTAEGVEEASDWDLVAALGCDVVQGYYVARPMPAEALVSWAAGWAAAATAPRRPATPHPDSST